MRRSTLKKINLNLLGTREKDIYGDQNFNEYIKKINNDYNLNLSNLFFEKNKFYKAKVKINFIKQLFVIEI